MSLLLGLLAFSAAQPTTTAAPTASTAVAESAAATAARRFLEDGDAARWQDAYALTSSNFRSQNTLQGWTAAAQKVRVPMGAIVSRTLVAESDVPSNPPELYVVKYQTSFADGRKASEIVSLVKEQGAWKVAGIYVQ